MTMVQIDALSNAEAISLANASGWFMEESEFTRNNPNVYATVAKDFLKLVSDYASETEEEATVRRTVYILEHNAINEQHVDCYSGKKPFRKGGHGYSQADWLKAWGLAKEIMVNRVVEYRMEGVPELLHKKEIVFHGKPSDYVPQICLCLKEN